MFGPQVKVEVNLKFTSDKFKLTSTFTPGCHKGTLAGHPDEIEGYIWGDLRVAQEGFIQ